MKYLPYPVFYLEESDFDDQGNFITIPNKPIFILFQSLRCYHCTHAKPAFLEFSKKNPDILCATIQMDSDKITPAFIKKINLIYPDLIGFPSYVLLYNGKKIVYDGDRTVLDMDNFMSSVIVQ
jgi:thiol-disulfide isomerase/thioredoxin